MNNVMHFFVDHDSESNFVGPVTWCGYICSIAVLHSHHLEELRVFERISIKVRLPATFNEQRKQKVVYSSGVHFIVVPIVFYVNWVGM